MSFSGSVVELLGDRLALARRHAAMLIVASVFWQESQSRQTHERLRSLVVNAYHASATRGEVAPPASEPGSVRAMARCGPSVPFIVRVKTAFGEERTYLAEGHPRFNLAAETWTFKDASEPLPK